MVSEKQQEDLEFIRKTINDFVVDPFVRATQHVYLDNFRRHMDLSEDRKRSDWGGWFPKPEQIEQSLGTTACRCNVSESSSQLNISCEVPGVKRDQLKVELDEPDRRLCIGGDVTKDVSFKDKDSDVVAFERYANRFERCFKLPKSALIDQMKAKVEDGLLQITIPKKEDPNAVRTSPNKKQIRLE